ncbi:MAG TPA: iron ABC transporter permease [Ramlibacter sp.]|nr:iron ABC transporter permease [Ramlibacter sp.]
MARWNAERWLLAGSLAFVLVFALLPLARLALEVIAALAGPQRGELWAGLASGAAWTASRHSLEVGIGGAVLAMAYGLLVATLVTLAPLRGRRWIVFAFVVQAMLPPQVVALAWLQLWTPLKQALAAAGWEGVATIGNPLQSRAGIIALLGVHYAPLVFLTVRAGLLNVPPDVIEAARVSGARPSRVVWRVVWPLVTPALAAGGALAFVSCIGNFGIPAFLGIPADYLVLPTLIYRELSGFGPAAIPRAALLSVLVGLLAAAGWLAQRLCTRPGHHQVISERLDAPPFSLGRWRAPVEGVLLALVTLLLAAPVLALVAKSLTPAPGVPLTWQTLTASNYAYVLHGNDATVRAFVNSIGLSVAAAVLLAAVSLVLAYQLEVRRQPWLRRLAPAIELPYVIPGVVLAMALILLYLKPLPLAGISLYNTVALIFIAYLARFLSIQLRPVVSGFQQLPAEMLEAAEVFGASFPRRLRRVVLPLLLPSVTAGALLVVLLAMNELTVSALLWSTGSETLGVVVFSLEQGGESAAACAIGVLTVGLTVLVMAAASRAGRHLPAGVLPWRA